MLHKYNRLLNFLVPAVVFNGLCLNLLLLLASWVFFYPLAPEDFKFLPPAKKSFTLSGGPMELLCRRGESCRLSAARVQSLLISSESGGCQT